MITDKLKAIERHLDAALEFVFAALAELSEVYDPQPTPEPEPQPQPRPGPVTPPPATPKPLANSDISLPAT